MNKLMLFVFFLLLSKNGFSQNQVEIYRNGIRGNMYMEQGQLDSAEKYYKIALAMTPDKTQFSQYYNLIKIADKHNDREKMGEYLTALSCKSPKDSIFGHLKEYADVSMDRATFDSLYHPKCNLAKEKKFSRSHPRAVDSLTEVIRKGDQAIRTKVNQKHYKRTEEEITTLEKEMHDIDSANFVLLYACMKKYGYPRIDPPLSWSRETQIMHIDNYEHFKKIDSYLQKAMKEGILCPIVYAYALDRSLISSGMQPKYYWLGANNAWAEKYKPGDKDMEQVNHERALIGLPPYPMWTGWGY